MSDQFGYYFAGGVKSYSKLECMRIGNTSFHFNDEVFSSIDTTKEPAEDLWTLYKARARQIRSKYDYVVLMCSGGSDSGNMLEAFLQADCKIDEICNCWDFPTTGDRNSHHNSEIVKVALHNVKELQAHGVDFFHRMIDISELAVTAPVKLGLDFEYKMNYYLSPNNVAKSFLREHVKEWADIINTGKKLVLVWGVEKPLMRYHDGKHWLLFRDAVDNCVSPYVIGKPGWFDELFYWTPDMPSIVIKQAHVIARFCKTDNMPVHYGKRDYWAGYNATLDMYLTYDTLKTVIYPDTWNPYTFCNGKALSFIYSARDDYFFSGNVNVDRYHDIIDSYFKKLNDETPRNQRLAMNSLYTREYEIC